MKKYEFNDPEIIVEQTNLASYFHRKKFAPDTIKVYCNYTGYFLEWLEKEVKEIQYQDLLQFVIYCKSEGRNPRNINLILTGVRHYFDMLQLTPNPATGLYLRGEKQAIPHDLLDPNELHQLYEQYPVYNERTQRNKVITGLYVYQGITTDELKKLESHHINLKEGKLHIPGTKQTHNKGGRRSRILKLKANQILELQEYLQITRPKIVEDIRTGERLKHSNQSRPARKPKVIKEASLQQQLFISLNGSEYIKNSIVRLMEDLRKINDRVQNGVQIRKSVIVNWLKEKDIRQVQYMAGHSSISSTERYRAANLEELEEALKIHHPLA